MQFEKAPNVGRTLTQDDWKRTQIRLPQDLYLSTVEYAKDRDLSINSAMLELIDKALNNQSSDIKPKAHYYTQKAYGLIYVAHGLESRISNIKFLLKTLTDDAQIQKYQLMLDMAQHDYEQVKIRLADALDIITDSGAAIDAELNSQAHKITKKKPTA